ncbi:MAG: dicarboxylate/amino acid:cation symporter [Clostridia bacterium]|nr:dicarboxylate/amino acid:cation symporter [Clostridia bacterium]
MEFLLKIHWMPYLALAVTLIAFVLISILSKKLGWTPVILIALVLGIGIGVLFASEDNAWLKWVDFLGKVYVRLLMLMVAPVILLSIVSGFIRLHGRADVRKVGLRSVFWLMFQAATAIVLSIAAAELTQIGRGAGSVFENLGGLDAGTVSAYAGLTRPFDQVLMDLLPSNVVGDIAGNNVPAIIIAGVAVAAAYLSVARKQGEEKVKPFADFAEAARKVVFKILRVLIHQTPYAVLCLIAVSAGKLLNSWQNMLQLLALMALIYAVCIVHTWVAGGLIVRFAAKLSPVRFFRKILPAQVTAFTTQSSIGTLPVNVRALKDDIGVSEEVANFTASLGTTIGMPGCTCIWTVLLVLFYVHAVGLPWGAAELVQLGLVTLLLSVGSAGVPGIAVVSAIGLFSAIGLPIGAVILMQPINTISDMIRTTNNVSSAAIATVVVARENNLIDDRVFSGAKEKAEEAVLQ